MQRMRERAEFKLNPRFQSQWLSELLAEIQERHFVGARGTAGLSKCVICCVRRPSSGWLQRKLETKLELRVWAKDEAFGIICMVVIWLTWGREVGYEISEGRKRQNRDPWKTSKFGHNKEEEETEGECNKRLGTLQIMPHRSQGNGRFQKRAYLVNPQRSQEE